MPRNPPGTIAERLAAWLETRQDRLLPAGAGSAADRRIAHSVLTEIRQSLSKKPAFGAKRGAAARLNQPLATSSATDAARMAWVVGALRDRTLRLLSRSRARDARAFRRLAGRAFEAFLSERLKTTRPGGANALTSRLLGKVFEDSERAVLVLDVRGNILHSNRAARRWYGYPAERLRRMNVVGLVAEPYRNQLPALFRTVLKDGHCAFEAAHERRDGTRLNVAVSGWVISEGKQRWVVCLQKEIAEEKRVQRDLRHVLSGAQCLIWQATLTARRGRIEWQGNPIDEKAAQRFFPLKLRRKEPYERAWLRARRDEDVARFREEVEQAVRDNRSSYTHEYRCVDAAGQIRWLHEDVRIEAAGKRIWRLTGLRTDVTRERRAEEDLRENVARFRNVFEEGPLGMALVGFDFSFKSVNRRLCDMLGYTEAELTRRKALDITHPDDIERGVELAEKVFRGEIPHYAIEKRYLKKNGEILWINLTASTIRDKDERPLYGLALIEDISERRRASEELERLISERTLELRKSEERFRTIFEQAAVGVALIETQTGRFIRINQKYCDIVGLKAEDMTATTFMAISHPEDLQADLDNMERLKAGKIDAFSMEKRYVRPDGAIVWVSLTVSPEWKIGGQPDHHIAVVEDITGRKRAESALLKTRDELESRVAERTAELVRTVDALEQEVVEKQQAESGLRESETKLSALIENATEAIWSVDTHRKLVAFNSFFSKQIASAFDRRPEVGTDMDEVLGGANLALVRAFIRSLLDRALGGEIFSVETTRRIKGVKRFFILSMQPIVDGDEIRGATVYTKDITDLKTVERELAGRLEFETLIARVSQTFINAGPTDLDSAITESLGLIGNFSNADRGRLFLFSRDLKRLVKTLEWCAEGVEPMIAHIDRLPPDFIPRMTNQLMGPEGVVLSNLRMPPAAPTAIQRVFLEEGVDSLVAVPLVAEGDQIGIIGLHSVREGRKWPGEMLQQLRIIGDIIANAVGRARAQRALAELGQRNQLILESAGEGIYGVDLNGRATFVNPAAARMIAWRAEDLIGKSMHQILHHTRPDGRPYPAEECPIYAAFRDGSARRIDNELFWRSDGSSFPAEYISTPIREEGRPVGAVVTFKDITRRKRAEEALLRVVEGTSGSVGEDFFRPLVRHLAAALRVRFAFLSECIDGAPNRARMLAFWEGDRFGECIEYAIKDTPCEDVFEHDQNFYPSGVRKRYPKDAWLGEIGAESYLAMPIHNSRGERLAHLGVLHDAPMREELSRDPILRIFAARAGAEVERKQAEEALARQAETEKVIGAISKRFIDVGPGEMDGAIDDALRLIGTFSGADRSYLFRFSLDLQVIDNSNEWHAEGVAPMVGRLRQVPAGMFPWALRKMERLETLRIDRLSDLPPEAAAEKAAMEARSIKSMLGVPIVSRNRLLGFLGFSSIHAERAWDDQTIRLLDLLSETLANALARDRAEGESRQLSHTNQLILNAAGEGIYGADTQGRGTFVNPAAARMVGWEVEELIGKPLHDVLHHTRPDGRPYPMEECPIYATLTRGVVQRVNQEFFWTKDGTSFPVEYIATPIREKGEISGVVVTFNDITQRKRAEEIRYHAQLLSQLPDAVLVMEGDGLISFWSKGAEGLTGYPVKEMLGQNLGRILAEGDPGGGLRTIVNRVSETGPGKEYQGEHLIRRKDGQTRLIAIHLLASPDPEGTRRSWIGIAQDVTEARGIQEEMFQAQRLAEVGTLAGGVAHEINNPLTVLSGNIQILLRRAHKKDPDRRRFEQMKRVCDRISEVVNALARVSAQGGEQWAFADPNDVVEETLLLIEQLHARKGVRLVRRFERDLPKVQLLQNGLQQVMMNIVMNAIDAMGDQGEVIVATSRGPASFVPPQRGLSPEGVSAMSGAPSICIRVTDTGHGIPEQELSKIFLPFFTTKEPGKGTGLGLAVARSIISIHRGTIDVESKAGKGTTFSIILPVS